MDEQTIRPYAEAHAKAVVDNDIAHLLSDFPETMHPQLGAIAGALPQPVTAAEVASVEVEVEGDSAVVHIRYEGPDRSVTVRSVWSGERPQIQHVAPV